MTVELRFPRGLVGLHEVARGVEGRVGADGGGAESDEARHLVGVAGLASVRDEAESSCACPCG